MRLRTLAPVALSMLLLGSSWAQSAAPLNFAEFPAGPTETISKEISEVRLVLTVSDRRGQFIKGLQAADLAVYDDGQAVDKLTFFGSQSELPLRIAVLLDASGSMANQIAFERKLTAEFFKKVVGPGDSAHLIAFDTESFVMDVRAADAQLRSLHKQRQNVGTAIYDAVTAACRRLNRNRDERARKVLLLVSDGDDNSSMTGVQQAIEAAWEAEVTVFVANVNHDKAPTDMVRLAGETGGQVWPSSTIHGVIAAFQHLQKALRSQYVLAYRLAEEHADGRFHPVRVVPLNKKLRALCRRGYLALRPTQPAAEPEN